MGSEERLELLVKKVEDGGKQDDKKDCKRIKDRPMLTYPFLYAHFTKD
jgi:hypothetical protein